MDPTTATLIAAIVTGLCSLLSVAVSKGGSWARGLLTGLSASCLTAIAMFAYFNYSRPLTPFERNIKAWNGEWSQLHVCSSRFRYGNYEHQD
jgi:hypothetical protein